MKLLVASDLHGSAYYTHCLLTRLEEEQADKMILLGDLLYHGPRNDLPRDYAPKIVAPALNAVAARLFCIRGNCDTEVDQMVLDFPILSDSALIWDGSRLLTAVHGHHLSEPAASHVREGAVILYGHTHIPLHEVRSGVTYLNPGSVSIPKNGSRHSYMTLENGVCLWKDAETGATYDSFSL